MNDVMYSVIVPVYGTAKSLTEIAKRSNKTFTELNVNYEIIFINDCSPHPDSASTLATLAQTDPNVKVITLTKNYGQQPATLCGIKHSSGDYIITIDDDLQHWPEDFPKLIEAQSHDIVIASLKQKQHSLPKRMFSRIKGHFDYLLIGKPKHIRMSPFRLMNRLVADAITDIRTPYPFIPALLFMVSKDIANVDIDHHERFDGQTTYTFRKMLQIFSNLMINNSSFLLKMLGRVGLLAALGSFLFAGYIFTKALFVGSSVPGWSSLVVLVLFLGGMMLFGLGVIGEYLIRIINTLEAQPTYTVRHIQSMTNNNGCHSQASVNNARAEQNQAVS
jgi:dolichol-phosphate mannosyltransferase/undecaprenyl-phosphate 4-deoxy-4-formamido-L-arabinose transferase